MPKRNEPAPPWVTDREPDEGIPTVGLPGRVEEPRDLYFESRPWAKYVGAGALERVAALSIHRMRRRGQNPGGPGLPWLAIGIGSTMAAVLVLVGALLVRWASAWVG